MKILCPNIGRGPKKFSKVYFYTSDVSDVCSLKRCSKKKNKEVSMYVLNYGWLGGVKEWRKEGRKEEKMKRSKEGKFKVNCVWGFVFCLFEAGTNYIDQASFKVTDRACSASECRD